MYSLNARDHFNCSPLLFSWPAHKTDAAKRKGVESTMITIINCLSEATIFSVKPFRHRRTDLCHSISAVTVHAMAVYFTEEPKKGNQLPSSTQQRVACAMITTSYNTIRLWFNGHSTSNRSRTAVESRSNRSVINALLASDGKVTNAWSRRLLWKFSCHCDGGERGRCTLMRGVALAILTGSKAEDMEMSLRSVGDMIHFSILWLVFVGHIFTIVS